MRGRLGALLALCAVVAVGFVFLQLPGESRLWHAVQNSGHGLVFALLAFAALGAAGPAGGAARIALTLSALFGLGAAIELAQQLTGRGASAPDLAMNLAGLLAGASLRAARASPTRARGALCAALAALALLWCLRRPLALSVAAATAPSLPLIEDFERVGASLRVSAGESARLDLVRAPADHDGERERALRARFAPGRWPGLRLLEPHRDWRAFERLTFTVRVPRGAPPPALAIRIDDVGSGVELRWYHRLSLVRGENRVSVPLKALRADRAVPAGAERTALADVRQVIVFVPGNDRARTLLFDDFALR